MIDVDVDLCGKALEQKSPPVAAMVPGLAVPVADVSAALADLRGRIGGPKDRPAFLEAPLRPGWGAVYWFFSLLFLAAAALGFFTQGMKEDYRDFFLVFLAAAFYLGLRGTVCFRSGAETLVARDGRAPVIYLRSFRDDDVMVQKSARFSLNVWRFLWTEYTRSGIRRLMWDRGKVRMEQAIEDEMQAIGPFIAIGQPGEARPDFGAVRAYFEGDDTAWREAVEKWMDRAVLIIVIPGLTKGLGWELERIFARSHGNRLVLVFPPENEAKRRERLATLDGMLPDTGWRAAAAAATGGKALVAMFAASSGEIVRCLATNPREREFDASVLLAQYVLLCQAPRR